jgi:beta-fructofuranosidase
MRPVRELETLRMEETIVSDVEVSSGGEIKLDFPGRELMELEVTLLTENAERYGVKVCVSEDGREETRIYYDQSDRKLKFDTRKSGLEFGRKIIEEAPLVLKNGEPLVLRIFIDKSIVEVFANDRQAIARRVYPTLGGRGIHLFTEGGDVEATNLKTWELSPSNPY